MLDGIRMIEGKTTNWYMNIYIHIKIRRKYFIMVFVSATGHMVTAGIYNIFHNPFFKLSFPH